MKIKHFTAATLAALMCLSSSMMNVFADDTSTDDHTTNIGYTVDESYKWQAPADIVFTSNIDTEVKTGTVSVTENIIEAAKTLVISIGSGEDFKLTSAEGAQRDYTVSKESEVLSAGSRVLIVPSGTYDGTQDLSFELQGVVTGNTTQKAGTYTGTLNFEANIETAGSGNPGGSGGSGGSGGGSWSGGSEGEGVFVPDGNYTMLDKPQLVQLLSDNSTKTSEDNTVTLSSDRGFRSDAELTDLQSVKIDGEVIDPSNYTTAEGSTIVTLTVDYAKTLSDGEHLIEIVSKNGSANASFEVKKAGATFKNSDNTETFLAWSELQDNNKVGTYSRYAATRVTDTELKYTSRYGAFYGCSKLTSITIPNSVTSIGNEAFSGCTILKRIDSDTDGVFNIPKSVTNIGDKAFYNCKALTSITIPDSVTSIGSINDSYGAFSGCTSLTSITFEENSQLQSIGKKAFSSCSNLTSITIPDSVTSIGGYAFDSCSKLTSITIPNSVTSIGEGIFSNCSNLKRINSDTDGVFNIPNSVTSIGNSAFSGCTGLISITIPNSVTSIGNSAFFRCTGLASITIPNGVTSIGSNTFYNCTGLISITIPNSVTSIGNDAFSYCTKLTSITIPDSVTSIGGAAFYNCPKVIYSGTPENFIANFGFNNLDSGVSKFYFTDDTSICVDSTHINLQSYNSLKTETIQKADCENEGVYKYYCKKCDHGYRIDYSNYYVDHDFSEGDTCKKCGSGKGTSTNDYYRIINNRELRSDQNANSNGEIYAKFIAPETKTYTFEINLTFEAYDDGSGNYVPYRTNLWEFNIHDDNNKTYSPDSWGENYTDYTGYHGSGSYEIDLSAGQVVYFDVLLPGTEVVTSCDTWCLSIR